MSKKFKYTLRDRKYLFDGDRLMGDNEVVRRDAFVFSDDSPIEHVARISSVWTLGICIIDIREDRNYHRNTAILGDSFRCKEIIKILNVPRYCRRPENVFDIMDTKEQYYIPLWVFSYDIGLHMSADGVEHVHAQNEADAFEMRLKL